MCIRDRSCNDHFNAHVNIHCQCQYSVWVNLVLNDIFNEAYVARLIFKLYDSNTVILL